MKIRFDLTALAATTLSLLAGTALAQDKTLTINSFGGAYETAHRKCVITPFEKETGATTRVVTAYSADAFAQVRAQKAAPQFDVIHFSGGQEIVAASEGLLAAIDAAKVPNLADLYPVAKAGLAKCAIKTWAMSTWRARLANTAVYIVANSCALGKSPTNCTPGVDKISVTWVQPMALGSLLRPMAFMAVAPLG